MEFKANNIKELKEAFESDCKNLTISFYSKQLKKFPKLNIKPRQGTVHLNLFTPNLESLNNVPMVGSFMNWLVVNEANLTRFETASDIHIDEDNCVCYLPCLGYKDFIITEDQINNSGFVRVALAWEQFTKPAISKLFKHNNYRFGACFQGMSDMDVDMQYLPDIVRKAVQNVNTLAYCEHDLAKAICEAEIGVLCQEAI